MPLNGTANDGVTIPMPRALRFQGYQCEGMGQGVPRKGAGLNKMRHGSFYCISSDGGASEPRFPTVTLCLQQAELERGYFRSRSPLPPGGGRGVGEGFELSSAANKFRRRTCVRVTAHMAPSTWRACLTLGMTLGSSLASTSSCRSSETTIDENLYSRQLYTLGRDAQLRVSASRVLISGLRGTGVETAKNLILAGVRSVTLHDDEDVQPSDLSGNYCLHQADVGANRAKSVESHLAGLNPEHVEVTVTRGAVTSHVLRDAGISVVVAADLPFGQLLELNTVCREANCRLVCATACGVFGSIFCDFGDEFRVDDTDGEDNRDIYLQHVAPDGAVTVAEDSPGHGLSAGDAVTFADVRGLPGLSEGSAFRVAKVKGPHRFFLDEAQAGDALAAGTYAGGGRARRVRQRATLEFQSLEEAARAWPIRSISTDASKDLPSRQLALHACFCTLEAMDTASLIAGTPGAQGRFEARVDDFCRAVAPTLEPDRAVVGAFWRQAAGSLRPMAALLGGLAAQEAIKACTHRWTPVHQFLFFDCVELVEGRNLPELSGTEALEGHRASLGPELCDALATLRVFLIGAGAIGCELLKNFAGMGMCLGEQGGAVHVTDMDLIERSNLNRQLLFRSDDIGKPKSTSAAAACARMAPGMKVNALQTKLDADSTHGQGDFGPAFWRAVDLVATALDNVDARMRADELCKKYGIPLVDSGTLGAKGSVQPSVPHATESYGATADPPETDGAVPFCTLKSFPYAVDHCIAWARDLFDGEFGGGINEAVRFLEHEGRFVRQFAHGGGDLDAEALGDALQRVVALLDRRPANYVECVARGVAVFAQHFDVAVRDLLAKHPADMVDDHGEPFWRGTKRRPQPIAFDPTVEAHTAFVRFAARLYADAYGVALPASAGGGGVDSFEATLRAALEGGLPTVVPPPAEAEDVGDDSPGSEDTVPSEEERARLFAEAEALLARADELRETLNDGKVKLTPLEFEKDDDANGHVDFVVAAANLRATNYDIPHTDAHSTRRIAGNIVPAIATTTSVVSALVCFEVMKIVQATRLQAADVDALRSQLRLSFINLALPLVAMNEPLAPVRMAVEGLGSFTEWDRLEVSAEILEDATIQGLVDYFEGQLSPSSILAISCDGKLIFSTVLPCAVAHTEPVAVAVRRLAPDAVVNNGTHAIAILSLSVLGGEGEEITVPPVEFTWAEA